MTWAQRLKRVFSIDVTVCAQCGGPVRVVAETSDRCIEEPDVIARILNHLAQISAWDHSYAGHPGRGPPQLDFFS
jgi:hypothetical protein